MTARVFVFVPSIPQPWRACLLSRLSAIRGQLYSYRVCLVYRGFFKTCPFCRKKIIACGPCSSRHLYCSKACSKAARLKSKRRSNQKNSQRSSSKLKKSRRQSRYRERSRFKKATGQSCQSKAPELLPKISSFKGSPKPTSLGVASRIRPNHCHYCGRGPLWLPATSEGQHFEDSS